MTLHVRIRSQLVSVTGRSTEKIMLANADKDLKREV